MDELRELEKVQVSLLEHSWVASWVEPTQWVHMMPQLRERVTVSANP